MNKSKATEIYAVDIAGDRFSINRVESLRKSRFCVGSKEIATSFRVLRNGRVLSNYNSSDKARVALLIRKNEQTK